MGAQVEAAYANSLARVPDTLWGSHPDLTLESLQEASVGAPYRSSSTVDRGPFVELAVTGRE